MLASRLPTYGIHVFLMYKSVLNLVRLTLVKNDDFVAIFCKHCYLILVLLVPGYFVKWLVLTCLKNYSARFKVSQIENAHWSILTYCAEYLIFSECDVVNWAVVSNQLSPDLLLFYVYYANCAVNRCCCYTFDIVRIPVKRADWSIVVRVIFEIDDGSNNLFLIENSLNSVKPHNVGASCD